MLISEFCQSFVDVESTKPRKGYLYFRVQKNVHILQIYHCAFVGWLAEKRESMNSKCSFCCNNKITHLDVIWSLGSNNTPVRGIRGPFLKIVPNLTHILLSFYTAART